MANRFVLKQFAGSATNNGAFGAAQATGAGVQPVANIEDVQSLAAFEQGWNSATLTADKLPPLEEMQGLEAILCKAIKELYSEGIPVWIAGETYYQNSRAVYNGKIYRNTTGSYTANNPATDTTNWELDKPDFAGIADKLGSSTVGSPSQGIYLVDGVPTPVTAVTGANVDLSNLTATGEAHFANPSLSNVSDGGRVRAVGWGMPDYSSGITGTLPFTAPKSGKISVNLSSVSNNDTTIYINGVLVGQVRNGNGGGIGCVPQFDVSGGDTITATGGYLGHNYFYYPCKGV